MKAQRGQPRTTAALGYWRTLGGGALVAAAVFATTYRVGGVLLYPRLLLALIGVALVLSRSRLHRLAYPPLLLMPVAGLMLVAATLNDRWEHLPLLAALMVRGVVLPYFAAITVLAGLGLLRPRPPDVHAKRLLAAACAALFLQLAVSFGQVLAPPVREAFISVVNLTEDWRQEAEGGYFRYSGIGGISIYDTAVAYCILASTLLLRIRATPRKLAWLRACGLSALVVLCLLHGRSGLMLALVLVATIGCRELASRHHRPLVTLRLAVVATALASVLYLMLDETLRSVIVGFGGELFINLASGQGLRSESTDDFLQNHLRLPPDDATLVFGSAYWAQPDLAQAIGMDYWTDSGILLLLNYGGMPLLLALLASLIGMSRAMARGVGRAGGTPHRSDLRAMLAYVVLVFALIVWKGPIFFSEHFMTAMFVILGGYAAVSRTLAGHEHSREPILAARHPRQQTAPQGTAGT